VITDNSGKCFLTFAALMAVNIEIAFPSGFLRRVVCYKFNGENFYLSLQGKSHSAYFYCYFFGLVFKPKTGIVRSYKTPINFYLTARRHIRED
jgi:hypothetical protein